MEKHFNILGHIELPKTSIKFYYFQLAILESPQLEAVYLDRNLFTEWPILPIGTVLDNLTTFSMSGNLLTELPPHSLTHFPGLQVGMHSIVLQIVG